MSLTLAQVTPSIYLAPAAPLVLYNVDNRYQYLRFTNNSPYQLSINLTGVPVNLSEFAVKDVEVPAWWQGSITVTPTVNISTASHAQSNLLTIEGYYKGEIDSPISQQIPQQAVTATASGKPIFSATIGFPNTVSTLQQLNIFNPPGSGITYTFHAAKAFTNDTSIPAVSLLMLSGADINLATGVTPGSHDGEAVPPVSTAHCTALDGANASGGTLIESQYLQAQVTADLLAFPDQYTLQPGNNLRLAITTGAAGKAVRFTMKWTEDIVTLPAGGLPMSIATSVINNGNAAPTPVVQASPAGDAGVATLINNDGSAVFGDASHSGKVTLNQLLLTLGTVSRIAIAGPYTVNPSPGAFFNHNLGVIPDFALPWLGGTIGAAHAVAAEQATMTSTQVKLTSDAAAVGPVFVLAIKF
jgi:hypothetical protein